MKDFYLLDEGLVTYKVYKDKGVVVCIIPDCAFVAVQRMERYLKPHYEVSNHFRYLIKDKYVGVARCSAMDEFDVEVGKKVALLKAKKKRAKAINKAIQKCQSDLNRASKLMTDYAYSVYDE